MNGMQAPLNTHEEMILGLRQLYSQYGYDNCRVANFEEYDFYVQNRSALSGEEVLVFTDADGRLMALKPDVTMSIVKNVREGAPGLRKFSYNESVYRIPTGGTGFRESVQTGLECIGKLDTYAVCEVLMLAIRSLKTVNASCILNLTHLEIIYGLLEQATESEAVRASILKAMEQKNLAALTAICQEKQIGAVCTQILQQLTGLFGPLRDTLPVVKNLAVGERMQNACRELEEISTVMEAYGLGDQIHLDFSIRGGTDYYSGLVFQGLVPETPDPVLRGGRYDRLINRMGKSGGGIGFAVCLDQLDNRNYQTEKTLLIYDDNTPAAQVAKAVEEMLQAGLPVRAEREIPPECENYRIVKLTEGGV